jgi:DNA ligase-1
MERFTQLFIELDESNRTNDKVAALEQYFREAPPEDAAWALAFLIGYKPPRAVNTTQLRQWAAEEAELPQWLLDECYDAVGDLGETIALILPAQHTGSSLPLHRVVEDRLLALKALTEDQRRDLVRKTWAEFDARQRFLWHKIMLGSFRVGVSRTLVSRALANVAGIRPAEMAHRLMGTWQTNAEDYLRITSPESDTIEVSRPYPFCLAHALEGKPEDLGDIHEWQAEWKWDGIRAQVIHRANEVIIWSRGEELITDRFPEVEAVGRMLPRGTVMDGEVLCWKDGRPLPFALLQKRIGRKSVGKKLLAEAPVAFVAYDLLEADGEDWRERPLAERRRKLDEIVSRTKGVAIHPSRYAANRGSAWSKASCSSGCHLPITPGA